MEKQINFCIITFVPAFSSIFISIFLYNSLYKIRLSKRISYSLMAIFGILQGIITLINSSIVMAFTSLLINFIIAFVLFRGKSIISKILYTILLTVSGALIETITFFVIVRLLNLNLDTLNANDLVKFEGVMISKLLLFSGVIIFRRFGKTNHVNLPLKHTFQFIPISIASVLIIYKIGADGYSGDIDILIDVLIITAIISTNFIVYNVFDVLMLKAELQSKHDLAEQQLDSQMTYYNELLDNRTKTVNLVQNIKNQFGQIESFATKNEGEHIREYIRRLNIDVAQNSKTMESGYPVIDAIIEGKKLDAERAGIEVDVVILLPDVLYVDDISLCILLGNAMDNAIEACNRTSLSKKGIFIEIKQVGSFFVIKVINTVDDYYSFSIDDYVTSKSNKNIHGFGLINMEKVVRKYDGDLQVSVDNNTFVLSVVLQKPMK
jgi:two-component system sensor histidine kinase AgrC